MRPVKLVHPSHARTILTEDDAARLRQAGWVELADHKSVSRGAAQQRRFRQRCRETGLKQLEVWLPQEAFDALETIRMPGETLAELLTRILCRKGE